MSPLKQIMFHIRCLLRGNFLRRERIRFHLQGLKRAFTTPLSFRF